MYNMELDGVSIVNIKWLGTNVKCLLTWKHYKVNQERPWTSCWESQNGQVGNLMYCTAITTQGLERWEAGFSSLGNNYFYPHLQGAAGNSGIELV